MYVREVLGNWLFGRTNFLKYKRLFGSTILQLVEETEADNMAEIQMESPEKSVDSKKK